MKIKQSQIFTALALACVSQAVFAAGGLGGAETFLNNIATYLKAFALIILTIAIMVAGYKVMWGGSTVREVVPIMIGGILVGSASYIASLLV